MWTMKPYMAGTDTGTNQVEDKKRTTTGYPLVCATGVLPEPFYGRFEEINIYKNRSFESIKNPASERTRDLKETDLFLILYKFDEIVIRQY